MLVASALFCVSGTIPAATATLELFAPGRAGDPFTVTLMVLGDAEIEQAGTNVVLVIAERLFLRPWSYLALIAVMLSTIGTLETSTLQFTRTMFAKGRAACCIRATRACTGAGRRRGLRTLS